VVGPGHGLPVPSRSDAAQRSAGCTISKSVQDAATASAEPGGAC
jgi:hypothetical protein